MAEFKDLTKLSFAFWILVVNCVCVYCALFPFNNVAQTLIAKRYGFDKDNKTPSRLMGIPYGMSAGMTPFVGLLVDKIGRRTIFVIGSTAAFIVAHFYMAFLPQYSEGDENYAVVFGLVLIGLGYAFFSSALWPSVPFVVKEKVVGSAFGIAMSCQQIGITVVPLLIGVLEDHTEYKEGYFWVHYLLNIQVSILLATCAVIGIVFGFILMIYDFRHGSILYSSKPEE